MNKKIMVAAGLVSSVVTGLFNNESEAFNDIGIQKTVTTKMGKVVNVKSNDSLNVRKSPTTSSNVLFTLKNSTLVNVIEQDVSTGWYKVSFEGKEGYASNRYIEILSNSVSNNYKVTGAINLRKTASWSADKLCVIAKGENVVVNSISGEWANISYKNYSGYAPVSYLQKINDGQTQIPTTPPQETPVTPPTTESMQTYKVKESIKIRKTASWSADKLCVAKTGSLLQVVEYGDTWSKVNYENVIGYAPTSYLEKVDNNATNPPTQIPVTPPANDSDNKDDVANDSIVKKGQVATVNTNDLNIRAGAATSYSILAKVNKGDVVLIKEKNANGWYKVELSTGIIGWCNGYYLENFREGSLSENQNPPISVDKSELINKVISIAKSQIGKPYKYGASGPDSFDCSGLTYYAYKNGANITLPRSSKDQANAGVFVSKTNLRDGDLIFFNTSGSGISHVGIYLGDNKMVHAPSSGKTIQIVDITNSYWASRYVTARRIIN